MSEQIFIFDNGIRLVHKQVSNTKVAHCGIMLDIGSRDEKPGQEGLAHFWEHMVFKGTKKRKAYHILNSLDSVGGELNAYTTKEKICFHATSLDIHFEKACELLSDITFNSIFPEKELEKERGVILEEMSMYYDSPEDALQDDFDQLIFGNHPLGNNILGTEETVAAFTRADFEAFLFENLNTEKIIFSSVSNLPFKKVLNIVGKHLSHIPTKVNKIERKKFLNYECRHLTKAREFTQAQSAIGSATYGLHHQNRQAFFLLNNILGGPAMNSKLNLELREKYGFVYSVESSYAPFSDTGLFAIYFATEIKHLKRCRELVMRQLNNFIKKPLSASQLDQYKAQLKGQLSIAEERNGGQMLMMAKSLLDFNRIESFQEILQGIEAITADKLQEVATEVFQESNLSSLSLVAE